MQDDSERAAAAWYDEVTADAETATRTLTPDSLVLFDGDTGTLAMGARIVLVRLCNGPYIDRERDAALWASLLANEAALRSRFHDLLLEIVLDLDNGIAFLRQIRIAGVAVPLLLRRMPLSFAESILVLHLRERLTRADVAGERAVADRDSLTEHLGLFKRATTTDHAAFSRQTDGAIEKMKKLNLLQTIRGSEDRYEIAPTLKILYSADEVAALTARYRALIAEASQDAPTATAAPAHHEGSE